ncbi:MAG: CCA tRNA nucleotidyltransferase, partial [Prevotella sp.]|nr:CCA tRNA nucleotidyltransferase [Prevotella sp.]
INGGAVRDAILGTDIHDLDFSTDATPEEMKEKLTGYEVEISMTNGGSIAKAHHPNGDWTDMVPIKGVYESLRGKPFVPADAVYDTYSTRLLDDTYTRDLTINSVYYDFQTNTIIDYHGGLHDLRDKIIRTVYDANTMYSINASALIRTVRFAARYGFDIDAATTTAIKDNMHYCKENITAPMNNYYICKGFGDGCVRRTYQYYSKYGFVDYFMLGLKGYAGTADYEEPMLKALEYIESKTKVSADLAMAAMYLPVMKARMTDQRKTLANITAAWDDLETTSGQKAIYEINDYSMERTAMLNTWYVYFSLTGSALSPESLEKLKENAYYAKGELLTEAYQ